VSEEPLAVRSGAAARVAARATRGQIHFFRRRPFVDSSLNTNFNTHHMLSICMQLLAVWRLAKLQISSGAQIS